MGVPTISLVRMPLRLRRASIRSAAVSCGRAWFASLLVAAGSAALPLSKGLLLVVCWYTPLLSYRRRGQVLALLHGDRRAEPLHL